jgi:leucyl/phenylalanyl-tRNA---protein transferase
VTRGPRGRSGDAAPGGSLARAPQPLAPSAWMFPDPRQADDEDVVGIGADLEPPTLGDAYRRGIFPWPHPGVSLPWFSPDPRGIITPSSLRGTRSLRQRLRRSGWTATVDAGFEAVITACAEQRRDDGTWITPSMQRAYTRMHGLGWAHSVEIWDDERLVGGLYGILVGGCFTGESMFHRVSDASKVALVELVDRFTSAGGSFVDVQIPTDPLRRRRGQVGTDGEEVTLDQMQALPQQTPFSAPAFRFGEPERKAALRHLYSAAQELSAGLGRSELDNRRNHRNGQFSSRS